MSNVIIWHRWDWKLSDGTIAAYHTSCTFVDGGKIGVHITRVSTTSRDFFTSSRNLTKRISIRRHVGKNDKDVQITFISKVLCGSGARRGVMIRSIVGSFAKLR